MGLDEAQSENARGRLSESTAVPDNQHALATPTEKAFNEYEKGASEKLQKEDGLDSPADSASKENDDDYPHGIQMVFIVTAIAMCNFVASLDSVSLNAFVCIIFIHC